MSEENRTNNQENRTNIEENCTNNEENCTNNQQEKMVQSEKTLREKVFEACHNMHSQEKKITRAAVRECTGGSDRDLSKYINEWKELFGLTVQKEDETGTVLSENELLTVQKENKTGTVFSENESSTVQSDGTVTSNKEALMVQNQNKEISLNKDFKSEVEEIIVNAYSNEPVDDIARVGRRGAERAAALLAGEDAVLAHLLENPDKLPEDLKAQVDIYRAQTEELVKKRQKQYDPNFFAAAAVNQFL